MTGVAVFLRNIDWAFNSAGQRRVDIRWISGWWDGRHIVAPAEYPRRSGISEETPWGQYARIEHSLPSVSSREEWESSWVIDIVEGEREPIEDGAVLVFLQNKTGLGRFGHPTRMPAGSFYGWVVFLPDGRVLHPQNGVAWGTNKEDVLRAFKNSKVVGFRQPWV